MTYEPTTIQPAHTLKTGARIKLGGQDLTLRNVVQTDDWVELYFTTPMWDPIKETWNRMFGCHFGFCIEVYNL